MVKVVDLADAILHAALEADADRVWIDPVPLAELCYVISLERRGAVIATSTLDADLAAAIIARFGVIADVDASGEQSATGTTGIRRGERARELVVVIKPGPQPRAELVLSAGSSRRAPTFRDLEPGDCVDHYRVVEQLGAGGMGCVYHVEHVTLGRPYALKVLHSDVLERDPRSIDRFVREARAASRIRHPNIIDVFDFGYLADGRPYFVMEMIESESLGDAIDEGGPIEPAKAIAIARQLASALGAAHEAGVIHADVTPSNILVSGDHVKLVDFGLAELSEHMVIDETATFVMGTPRYVAPERLLGRAASPACDQYALGVVLFEMITGITPFHSPDLRQLCQQHIAEPVPQMMSPYGALPPELDRFVARCMAKSPAHRFPSMAELATELDSLVWFLERGGNRAVS